METPAPLVTAICQVKVPVTDVERSARWYCALLDLRLVREFVEEGVVAGAVLANQGGAGFVISMRLRDRIPGRPQMPGFDLFSLRVQDLESMHGLLARCEELGVEHGDLIDRGSDGHHLDVTDPDGTNIRFLTPGAPDAPAFAGVVFSEAGPATFYDQPRLHI